MTKDPSRKAPKRARKISLDADLAEIAIAIDTQRLDNDANGWFSIPWREGWNAIRLAMDVAHLVEDTCPTATSCREILDQIASWLTNGSLSSRTYQELGNLLERGSMHAITRALCRCYQTMIARSDAGGDGYNAILRPAIEPMLPERVSEIIKRWRRIDALGPLFSSGKKRAFDLAWERGLYRAAYAL